jgi:hypothetical protein
MEEVAHMLSPSSLQFSTVYVHLDKVDLALR